MTPDSPPEAQAPPSPEEMQKMTAVGQAGMEAQAEGRDRKQAMKDKRDEVGLKMSDDELEQMGEFIFGKLEALFRESGALDPPFEAPKVEQPSPPPPPADPGAGAEQVPPPPEPAPQKRTAAQRFFGVG